MCLVCTVCTDGDMDVVCELCTLVCDCVCVFVLVGALRRGHCLVKLKEER